MVRDGKEFTINGRRLLPINEAAHYLGLSKRTLYNNWKCAKGRIPKPKRFGRKLLWDAYDLKEFVDNLITE